jgi:hypothetical protein
MNCWHCNNELTWDGDHDIDEEDTDYMMVTNLSCLKCDAFVLVYLPRKNEGEKK